MKQEPESRWSLLLMAAALAVIGALYFRGLQQPINGLHELTLPSVPTPVAAPLDEQSSPTPDTPVIHPIDQALAGHGLPAATTAEHAESPEQAATTTLEQSFEAGLAAMVGSATFAELFVSDDLINRIVVSVDNLSHEKLPVRLWPVRPVGGLPLVSSGLGPLTLGPDNSARYSTYVRLLERLDLKQLAALYVRDYDRFQQAYAALGYPNGYFNDRLVDVIDHLLVTPEISSPLLVVQPKVMYQFADQGLESRSIGQKILLRMGPANAGIVKLRLRELRRLVTRGAP